MAFPILLLEIYNGLKIKGTSIHRVMPSIIYGGVRYTQARHVLYCKKNVLKQSNADMIKILNTVPAGPLE
jgi:hypothetical protein